MLSRKCRATALYIFSEKIEFRFQLLQNRTAFHLLKAKQKIEVKIEVWEKP